MKYQVSWSEYVTYSVDVAAENEDDAVEAAQSGDEIPEETGSEIVPNSIEVEPLSQGTQGTESRTQ